MPTSNLGITYVVASQSQKEVTINAGLEALDAAGNTTVSVDCTAAGTIAVVAGDYVGSVCLRLTGTPAGAFNFRVPDTARLFVVDNASGQDADVRSTAGGTTTTVPTGNIGFFLNRGSNAVPIGITSGTGISAIASATDVNLTGLADFDLFRYDSGGGEWVNATLSDVLDDRIGSTHGTLAMRGASGWEALAPGNAGDLLASGGIGVDPSWLGGIVDAQDLTSGLAVVLVTLVAPITHIVLASATVGTKTVVLPSASGYDGKIVRITDYQGTLDVDNPLSVSAVSGSVHHDTTMTVTNPYASVTLQAYAAQNAWLLAHALL